MMLLIPITLLLYVISTTDQSSAVAAIPVWYNVVTLGANPNGRTDSTNSFLHAWNAACASPNAATIYVPRGCFLVKSVVFSGKCKNRGITIRIDGTLVAPDDYNVIGSSTYWLSFQYVDGLKIVGGTVDGRGTRLWACKASTKNGNCPSGATSLGFNNCKNVAINGLTSINSQMFHIVLNGCQNVKMQGVTIFAPGDSPNTDGIHVQLSSNVAIMLSNIGTGDDCVSIGPGTTNLWIENVRCGPGHGISIGSLGKDLEEEGVQNVTVKTVTFTGTQNGVRIKSWGRPSNGFVKGVVFQNVYMVNVQNPIFIDQNYCPSHQGCPGKVSGVKIKDVTYQNIHGTSATAVAVKFDCSPKNPCTGIRLEDVKLRYGNKQAEASCVNAGGSVSGLVEPSSCL